MHLELNAQQKLVKDSLMRAFDALYAGKGRKDARKLFKKAESRHGAINNMITTDYFVELSRSA